MEATLQAGMTKKPNILFILSDQHNAKVLGHKQHPDVKTPNLDRMASEGVRFENAVTQNPICTPSRMCYISGQYCHNHGYYGLSGGNPGGLPTVFGHFRRSGYTTAAIGKIHCPEYWVEDDCDEFHETCGCSVGGRSSEYTAFLTERDKAQLEDHGGLPEFGKAGIQSMEGRPSPLLVEESQEGWIAGKAIEFMKQATDKKQPFFVHASLPRPHQCTAPSQEFWDLYDDTKLTLPPNADYEMTGKVPHMKKTSEGWRTGTWTLFEPKTFEAGRLRKLRGYLAAISQVDHAVGLMLDHIRQAGLAEDTIVVYSSDHGDYACEHGIMEKAPGICSDAITRIPHIWWAPKRFKADHTANELVETVDMTNTLCALAGLENMETSDGKDISHLLRGRQGEVRRIGVTEFPWSRSVRKGRYRMVYYPRDMFEKEYPEGFGELYDLEQDPWEMQNLFFDKEYADVIKDMQLEFIDWLITTTRPATVQPPTSNKNAQASIRYNNACNADGKIHPDYIRTIQNMNYI